MTGTTTNLQSSFGRGDFRGGGCMSVVLPLHEEWGALQQQQSRTSARWNSWSSLRHRYKLTEGGRRVNWLKQ